MWKHHVYNLKLEILLRAIRRAACEHRFNASLFDLLNIKLVLPYLLTKNVVIKET